MKTKEIEFSKKNIILLMLKYGIVGLRARQKGKPSVRLLAYMTGCNYSSLNDAMNGKRPFSDLIKSKLNYFFYYLENEKSNNNY